MKSLAKLIRNERFEMNWLRLLVQGVLILLTGITFAFTSVVKSDAVILSATLFSWLPVCGMIVLSLGLLEWLDALFSKDLRDFFQGIYDGILDTVIGTLLILSIFENPDRISSMITVYLLVRGLSRLILSFALKLRHAAPNLAASFASIILGLMVWAGWPTGESWFLAMCISAEIAFRGLEMIYFALLVKGQKDIPSGNKALASSSG